MRGEQGFTLSEMLVAMVIGGLVMAATYSTYMTQSRSYKTNEAVTALQQNLRSAMYHLERELRMVGYDPTASMTVNFGFTNRVSNSVTFTMDSNGNGVLDTNESITYARNATENTLTRNSGGGATALALDITEVEFLYYKEDGTTEATTHAEVRSVKVTLKASEGAHERELSTMVRCRNMGL